MVSEHGQLFFFVFGRYFIGITGIIGNAVAGHHFWGISCHRKVWSGLAPSARGGRTLTSTQEQFLSCCPSSVWFIPWVVAISDARRESKKNELRSP